MASPLAELVEPGLAIGGGVVDELPSVFKLDWLELEFEAIVPLSPFLELWVFRMISKQSAITNTPTTTLYDRLLLAVSVFETDFAAGVIRAVLVGTAGASLVASDIAAMALGVTAVALVALAIPPTMFG